MHMHRPAHTLLMEAGLTELGLEEPPGSRTRPGGSCSRSAPCREGRGSRERLRFGSQIQDSLTRCLFGLVGPFGRAPGLLRRIPRLWIYFCSISASGPKTTARAARSSSRSIRSSPKLCVYGVPVELADPVGEVEVEVGGHRRVTNSELRARGDLDPVSISDLPQDAGRYPSRHDARRSCVTTAPVPTTASCPIVTPGQTLTPPPSHTLSASVMG